MTFLRRLLRYAGSVVLCAVFGSLWQSGHNLAQIAGLGFPPSPGEVWSTMVHDLLHFAPTFALLSGAALLVAFLITTKMVAWTGGHRMAWFGAGGALSILALLAIMGWALPVTAIAAARDAIGVAGLCLGGGLAGLAFTATAPAKDY
ncbi:MAG: hypothetical protein RIK00_02335 [Algiphilus sp.]|uniref:hypothetical protein n=1 Tax=Algiphilus sp. TaxID=1872431 RepID=UPI0032EE070B